MKDDAERARATLISAMEHDKRSQRRIAAGYSTSITSDEAIKAIVLAQQPEGWREALDDCMIDRRDDAIATWNTRAPTASEAERVREACAKVAESHAAPKGVPQIDYDQACHDIAAAIRSLPIGGE